MHCGLWFASQGHISHQRNCHLQEMDRRVQEPGAGALEADSEVDSSPESTESVGWGAQTPGLDPETDSGVDPSPESTDGIEEGANPMTLTQGSDPSPGGSAPAATGSARTDGGLGLSGPPEPPTPVEDDADVASCPACGDDLGTDPDEFREGKTYRCTDCGERWTGVP